MNRRTRELVQVLTSERDDARRNLERVVAQRDELRRVLGDVRRYARDEARRALAGENGGPLAAYRAMYPTVEAQALRPTVHLAAHLDDPEPTATLSACYHPAEDSSLEGFYHRCHGNHEPCPAGGHGVVIPE